ncbi:hypothetical protein RCL1_004317 [Eukaryota sp. TZLM3-RCL]
MDSPTLSLSDDENTPTGPSLTSLNNDSFSFDAETQAIMSNLERELGRATEILNMPHFKSSTKKSSTPCISKTSSSADPPLSTDVKNQESDLLRKELSDLKRTTTHSQSKIRELEEQLQSLRLKFDDVSRERDELKSTLTAQEQSVTGKMTSLQSQVTKLINNAKAKENEYIRQIETKSSENSLLVEKLEQLSQQLTASEAEITTLKSKQTPNQNMVSNVVGTVNQIKSDVEQLKIDNSVQFNNIKSFFDHRLSELFTHFVNISGGVSVDDVQTMDISFDSQELGHVKPSASLTMKHSRVDADKKSKAKKKRSVRSSVSSGVAVPSIVSKAEKANRTAKAFLTTVRH